MDSLLDLRGEAACAVFIVYLRQVVSTPKERKSFIPSGSHLNEQASVTDKFY